MTTGLGGVAGAKPAALVFVHGGAHTGRCWDETIAVTPELLPDVDAFAVDLPGRRGIPGELAYLTHDICAHAVADQIRARVGPEPTAPCFLLEPDALFATMATTSGVRSGGQVESAGFRAVLSSAQSSASACGALRHSFGKDI